MYFRRYYLGCLAHASYLVGDEKTKVAAVIDPQRDIDQYVADAAAHGFQIRYVFLTHFHADFVAGHIELRDKTGAKIYLGAAATAEYDFTPVKDGDVVEFGQVRLSVLETPGHTPEGISLLIFDLNESDRRPHAVLTGDTLFIGDVGRPDLLASMGVTADQLAEMLYHSLHDKLLKLPNETLVYPAHGAGSMCGKQLSHEAVSTIGDQRKYNYALQPMSLPEFKAIVMAEQPEMPDYFLHDAMMNRQDRKTLDDSLERSLQALPLSEVLKRQAQGTQLLDVRDAADFAAAHIKGALNVGLDGKYATWCGTVLDRSQPIIVIAAEDRVREAVMRLGRIGFDRVQGYLSGGPASLEHAEPHLTHVDRITARALWERWHSEPRRVLDVRTENEWNQGHIEGSVNIPLHQLTERSHELAVDEPLVVHCQSGYRSSLAASILQASGFEHIYDLVGGFEAWKASQLPVVRPALTNG